MKNFLLIILLLSLSLSCNKLKISEPISLFNGNNLDGWVIYGTEKWYVEDNELVCESGPDKAYGYLGTEDYYDNFILDLEFKQESNGNSGVFFRSTVDGTKVKGWQVEVAPPSYYSGGIYESYGRGWLIKPDSSLDSIVKMGEWNRMKIKVYDDKVTTWINDTEMISLKDSIISKGKGGIALQIHDGGGIKVKWKNLMLEKLD